jgi:hypothetical protein
MAEYLMETTVRAALWQQFSAAIAMLENALLACPETLWQEHLWIDVESADEGTFWEITYHTLGCLDRFLTGCPWHIREHGECADAAMEILLYRIPYA